MIPAAVADADLHEKPDRTSSVLLPKARSLNRSERIQDRAHSLQLAAAFTSDEDDETTLRWKLPCSDSTELAEVLLQGAFVPAI
jgi:hypothetical protein